MQGQIRQDGLRSRSSSIGSDATQASKSSSFFVQLPTVNPPPAYVTSAAATEKTSERLILTPKLRLKVLDEDDEDNTSAYEWDGALFSSAALAMVNAFLDQLLYSFLARSRSTTLQALRPAVEHVLKGKLARETIATADGELDELLAGGEDEDELAMIEEEREGRAKFDLVAAWKRSRLRVMVYIGLGEMEEEDEQRHVEELVTQAEGSATPIDEESGLVSWGAAIFLTASLEFIAEQLLFAGAQVAYDQAALKRGDKSLSTEESQAEAMDERTIVGERHIERGALDSPLHRLWRTWKKKLRTPRIVRNFTPPATPAAPLTPSHGKSLSSAGPQTPRVSHPNARSGSWPQQVRTPSMQSTKADQSVEPGTEDPGNDGGIRVLPPPLAKEALASNPPDVIEPRRRSFETSKLLSPDRKSSGGSVSPPSPASRNMTLVRSRSSSAPSPMPSPLQLPPYTNYLSIPPDAEDVPATPMSTDRMADAAVAKDEAAAEAEGVVSGEAIDLSTLNAENIGGQTVTVVEDDVGGQRALKSSLLAPTVQGEEDARRILEAQIAQTIARDPTRGVVAIGGPEDPIIEEEEYEDEQGDNYETAKTSAEIDDVDEPKPLVFVDSNDPTLNVLGSTPRQPRRTASEDPETIYMQRPPRQRGPNGSISNGSGDTSLKDRSKGLPAMTTFYNEERAYVRRVSDSSASKTSKTTNPPRSTSLEKKQLRSSDDTGESYHTAVARSEALQREFANLVQGEETKKFTLTPQNLVEIEQPDSPQMRQDAAAAAAMEQEFAAATADREGHGRNVINNSRQTPRPIDSDILPSPPFASSSQTSPASPMASLPGSVPDSPHGSREQRGSVPRPPRTNSRPSKGGFLAREARIQTESTRDLADLIRSTAPTSPDQGPQPISSGPPSRQEPAGASRTGGITKILSRNPSVSNNSSPSAPSVSSSSKNRAPPKAALQPRDPTIVSSNTADLIAFFKQGPPGAQLSDSDPVASRARQADSITGASSGKYANSLASQSIPGSVNSYSGLISNNSSANKAAAQPATAMGPPPRKQRRMKDPYAIDMSDDEDELTVLPGGKIGPPTSQQESLIDFLNNVPPPGEIDTHTPADEAFNTGWRGTPPPNASSSANRQITPTAEGGTDAPIAGGRKPSGSAAVRGLWKRIGA